MIQDIPKLYTALAEWLACVLFVRLLPQRYNAAKTAGILAAALPLFGLVQWLIGIVPLSLWIPGMIVALVLMYATIWLCCRLNFCDTGFWWALAFTLAEFVASLEWQLYSFGASKMPGSWWIQGLFLLAFYGGGFGVFLRLEQKRLRDKAPLHMTRRESISAAVIAICTFLISNISYVTTNTPFSGRMTTEIFWIRTLVDFAGVAVLLSMQDRWQDMQTQHELTAIQTLLKRQYEQYRISRDNSEAINRKYHDLKHQIQVIRMESDAARREEYLSQLEKGMQSLGVNQHTGNDVLDTILSDKQLYCSQHQITLTIVADGARLDFIETMDICSIFGNALDNAIEGVEKLADPQQRLIRVAVYTQNVFLIIRVENYCTAQLSVVDGEYRTTKHDKDMHGYGIKSIRYTAEKYGGSVSAGETELSEIREADLMENITYISHQSYLFKGTVRDNLLMGKPDASDSELWEVLERVNLADFVRNEKGLDTGLSEKASNLSGGQCQRLALARALLHDSPIYIFDEATSNIDVESENDIMNEIQNLAESKTVILISHRLVNVVKADAIYVMVNGKIAESGKHRELLENKADYEKLWEAQQRLENYGKDGAVQ